MKEYFVTFKDFEGHWCCLQTKDIRQITFAYDNYYLVIYDTRTKGKKWASIQVTTEEAEKLSINLTVVMSPLYRPARPRQ